MPKKTFRSNNSTVVIKRSKFGAITRQKVINKRPKLILIDEKNENNWKYLKSELGYKSDTLFLEYLLSLAQRDLNLLRQRKYQFSNENENEEALKTVDCNSAINNEKQTNSLSLHKTKFKNSPNPVENEKKREVENECGTVPPHNTSYVGNTLKDIIEEKNLGDKEVTKPLVEDLKSTCNFVTDTLNVNGSKFISEESTNNVKTETAKDLELDSITLTDRNSEQNVNVFSGIKEFNLFSSSDKMLFNQCKNSSAMVEMSNVRSSDDKSIDGIYKRDNHVSLEETPSKNTIAQQKHNENRVKKSKSESKKQQLVAEKRMRNETNVRSKENESGNKCEDENVNDFRLAFKIKLCTICNKRHIMGTCPVQNSALSNEKELDSSSSFNRFPEKYFTKDPFIKGSSGDVYFSIDHKSEKTNVYDFDENERESNLDGNIRWCPKLLKSRESVDAYSTIVKTANKTEVLESRINAEFRPTVDDGNNSDSSSSGLKLRIDESFGENTCFAESSLPDHLSLKVFDEGHGQSVFTKIHIEKFTHFGPLLGQKVKEMDIPDDFNMKFIWEINSVDGVTYISTKDTEFSNWLRFLRPASSKNTANLITSVKENCLYFVTTRDINDGEELVYWMDDIHSAWSKKKLEKKNCGGCNIQFSHPLYYRRHCMIFHDPSCSLTIRKYHCKICGLAVLGKEKIMKHAAEMHQGKGAYQCQYCHKFFLRLNYLEMHRTYGCSKNPQRSRPLCDLCGRKFCQPQKLKVHIKRMHSDMAQVLKDFQCKSCLKILGSRAALQRHMKEVHNKDIVGACTCDRCGKMFQNKSNLKIHMLTHSGVKPFKCQQPDCTAAFTTKQCLQFHYKKVHGFTDDFIPKIERSIAYTFDAYSGGVVSEPSRVQSPRFEERSSPVSEQRECGLDLSLVTLPSENNRARSVHEDSINQQRLNCGIEDSKSITGEPRYLSKEVCERSPEYTSIKEEEDETNNKKIEDGSLECNQGTKIIVSKGSKKWMGSDATNEKCDERFKSIFRHENSNASLLVEAAINAAEKDIIDKPAEKRSTFNQESLIDNPAEIYSINQYVSSSPDAVYESNEKKLDDYGKISVNSQKFDSFQEVENKKVYPGNEKTNLNDFLRCSSLLRINTSPVNEMPKDYNISSIIRDQETESFTDIEIQDYRNRDLLETYKENETFHEPYRSHELYRSEKLDLYRCGDSEFRMSGVDKFDYRDFDLSNETYRNLATNLEKYRNADIYRLRGEGYELGVGYRELSDERDGEAQNLCLKEKSLQYETLEELARIGRDNPGFECLLVGDSCGTGGNQPFAGGAPRGLHGMLSPRPYHPTYESESVDLSVPRPSYSTSPIYTLDLTPTRVELPTRHLDLRSHLGLSPHRFPNSRIPGLSNATSQVSPTGYSVYSSPYVNPARHSPTSQFQPYTSLYY